MNFFLCCSEGGIRYMSRVIMCNTECLRRFGSPRSQAAYSSILGNLSEDARKARHTWLMNILQASSTVCIVSFLHANQDSVAKMLLCTPPCSMFHSMTRLPVDEDFLC